jgi:aminoglycoside phosphotransferase (APT) family kinase protein
VQMFRHSNHAVSESRLHQTDHRSTPTDLLAELRRARCLDPAEQDQAVTDLGLRPLTGGRNNHVYAWDSPEGTICIKVYKVDGRRRPEREWHALTLLAAYDVPNVPRLLWRDDFADSPAVGMTFVTGTAIPDEAPDNHEASLAGLIETWRHIHTVRLEGPLADLVRIDSAAHYVARITDIWAKQLADHRTDPLTPHLEALLGLWSNSSDRQILAEPQPPMFSRGDANLLNWLHNPATGKTGCVDFEFSGTSDPAFDVADLVEHISSRTFSDDVWSDVVDALGEGDQKFTRRFRAAQRTCALRWLAVLWKQRHARSEEFKAQLERARRLHQLPTR